MLSAFNKLLLFLLGTANDDYQPSFQQKESVIRTELEDVLLKHKLTILEFSAQKRIGF